MGLTWGEYALTDPGRGSGMGEPHFRASLPWPGSVNALEGAEPRRAPVASRPSGEVGAGPSVPGPPGTSAPSSALDDAAAHASQPAGAPTGSPAAGHDDDTSLGSVAASSSTPASRRSPSPGGVLA